VPGLAGDHSTLHINVWDTEILKKGMNPTAHILHDGLRQRNPEMQREGKYDGQTNVVGNNM
jgi:hypothetical protein